MTNNFRWNLPLSKRDQEVSDVGQLMVVDLHGAGYWQEGSYRFCFLALDQAISVGC
jgi:hypothetical protein